MKASQKAPWWMSQHVWLILILVWAAVLRFYKFGAIPFTGDEFSALARLKFSSFNELIQKGVIPDFHPAGTQVLMWFWGNLFGFSEASLKFPFALFGLGSVYLSYLLGKQWFNKSTGLIVAALIGCTQYFVFYAQIARPYGMGLFFCLLALLFWKYVVFNKNPSAKYYLGWVLSAAAVAYTHYFALLFLVLVGASGLLLVSRKRLLYYLLAAVVVAILYLPHFPIFFTQLAKGGVESWLAKPTWSFVPDYLGYMFHYSWPFAMVVLFGFIIGKAVGPKQPFKSDSVKLAFLGIFWWVGCFLVGYFYSVYNSAILQYSGLLFAAPFGLLGVVYLFRFPQKWAPAFATVILLAGTTSLIFGRKHYFMLYNSPYEQLIKEITKMQQDGDDALYLLAQESNIFEYYKQQLGLDTSQIVATRNFTLHQLKQIIDTTIAEKLVVAEMYYTPLEIRAHAAEKFPTMMQSKNYYQARFHVFTKDTSKPPYWAKAYWQEENVAVKFQQNLVPKGFGANVRVDSLSEIVKHERDEFHFWVTFADSITNQDVQLAAAVYEGDSIVNYRSKPILSNQPAGTKHFHSFRLLPEYTSNPKYYLKCFAWNFSGDTLQIDRFGLNIREGNPYLYGLYLDF